MADTSEPTNSAGPPAGSGGEGGAAGSGGGAGSVPAATLWYFPFQGQLAVRAVQGRSCVPQPGSLPAPRPPPPLPFTVRRRHPPGPPAGRAEPLRLALAAAGVPFRFVPVEAADSLKDDLEHYHFGQVAAQACRRLAQQKRGLAGWLAGRAVAAWAAAPPPGATYCAME